MKFASPLKSVRAGSNCMSLSWLICLSVHCSVIQLTCEQVCITAPAETDATESLVSCLVSTTVSSGLYFLCPSPPPRVQFPLQPPPLNPRLLSSSPSFFLAFCQFLMANSASDSSCPLLFFFPHRRIFNLEIVDFWFQDVELFSTSCLLSSVFPFYFLLFPNFYFFLSFSIASSPFATPLSSCGISEWNRWKS